MDYKEQLSKKHFEIQDNIDDIDALLKNAQEHPAELSKKDAAAVAAFVIEADLLMKKFFLLFIEMSEEV